MKSTINKFITHPLFSGSLIMVLGSNGISFINYIYHFTMGRILSTSNYGELVTLFALMGLVGIIPSSLGLVIVKYVSAAKKDQEVSQIVNWFERKIFLASLIVLVFFILISSILSGFLNIKNPMLIATVGLITFFSLPGLFNRSVLQGLLRFKQMMSTVLLENTAKLILGATLVLIGFQVMGAMAGFILAVFLGWLLSRYYLRTFYNKGNYDALHLKSWLSYSIPVILQSIAITSLSSTDLVLVKHFFTPSDTGLYAALSTLGKIIFFSTGPIGVVMFPLISQRHSKGEHFQKVFLFSILATLFLSFGILFVYWLFPNLVITFLYGSKYLPAAHLLIWFGLFMYLFTLSSLMINFYLSLGKTGVVILPFLAALLQFIGIWFYHNDLKEVIMVSIVVAALLTASLLIYFRYGDGFNFGHSPNV